MPSVFYALSGAKMYSMYLIYNNRMKQIKHRVKSTAVSSPFVGFSRLLHGAGRLVFVACGGVLATQPGNTMHCRHRLLKTQYTYVLLCTVHRVLGVFLCPVFGTRCVQRAIPASYRGRECQDYRQNTREYSDTYTLSFHLVEYREISKQNAGIRLSGML